MTLIESMVSFGIVMMIGGSFMSVYTMSVTSAGRVATMNYTAWDAANAVDRINLALREARRFQFMDNGTTGPTAYQTPSNLGNDSNYYATVSGGSVVTGIHIIYPATLSNVSLDIPSGSSFSTTAMSGSNAMVDYRTDGAYMDVYRSDAQGHPAPSNGTCVWIRGTWNGAAIPTDPNADTSKGIDGMPLIKDVATGAGSVQFIQGQANEVMIKVVTGDYDRYFNQSTFDNTKGTAISLSAENSYLRNHDPNGVTAGSSHGKTQYTGN